MPQNWKEGIPSEQTKNFLLGKKIHYGLDLAGGSQLDFKVDMSRVREKIAAGENIREEDVLNGVKSTLQRRIDPDGTRELNIYASDFDGEKHIFVELTSDIDTPETREKLLKRIDLEFKEPNTETGDAEKNKIETLANEALQKAIEGTSLEELETEYAPTAEESFYHISLNPDQKKYQDQLPKDLAEELWGAEPNTVFSKLIPTEGNYTIDQFSQQLRPIEGFSIALLKSKEMTDRTKKESGEDFTTVADEVSEDEVREKTVDELPEDTRQTVLTTVQPNQISEVLEVEGKFVVYKLINAVDENSPARVLQIVTTKKEATEAARKRVMSQDVTTKEEQLVYDELFFEAVPEQWKSIGLDGQYFKIAKISQDQTGLPVTSIEFTNEGAQKFEEITGRLVGKPMAIFVGGEFISAPIIQEKISGGTAQISFKRSLNYLEAQKEAISLARDLNAGAIPAPIALDGEVKIAASLGIDALQTSLLGAGIGFVLLSIWLLFSYRVLGLFAVFSLCVYVVLLVGILKFFPQFVLTLSGIAGVILSVGMAVDANVLIFERMREELRSGKNFSTSIAVGFDRAWTSIRDANLTTLIVCGILYLFGTSMIKGFATMLAIGITLSMFTAIAVTRVFMKTIVGTKISRNPALLTKL